MPTIEEQLNHFVVHVGTGSGCLFQPNTDQYTYVLTAKHNLPKDNPENVVVRRQAPRNEILRVQNVLPHADAKIDLALIVVDLVDSNHCRSYYASSERGEELSIYGFPQRQGEGDPDEIRCRRTLVYGYKFELETVNAQHTWEMGAGTNVVGFSGSGVFLFIENQVILKGIFTDLKHPDGANNKVYAYPINLFDSIIAEHHLMQLTPTCLESFQCYLPLCFESLPQTKKNLLMAYAEVVVQQGISPKMVADRFKGNLFTPYTSEFRNKLLNDHVWKAWIELLTYCYISDDNDEHDSTEQYKSVRLYHSEKGKRMDEIIKELLTDKDNISELRDKDIVTISNCNNPGINKHYNSDKVKNIIPDIGRDNGQKGLYVNRPRMPIPSITCVHISHFSDVVEEIEVDDEELITAIKSELKKILKNGNN